jgi:prepilin-type N-terminal cleavage/methylation domain-containing protein
MDVCNKLAPCATNRQKKRGFTLTEIAIVLGIIGLILGAIWVAAAAVYNNLRVSKATTELLQVAQGVRAMYATSSTVDSGADMTAYGTTAQSGGGLSYLVSGIFPSDTLNATPPTRALDPWGGNINVQSATQTVTSDSFYVVFDNVPQNACISLLTSNTGTGRDSGMVGAGAGAAGALPANAAPVASTATLAAVTPSVARGQCIAAPALSAVGFAFRLRS